MNQIQNLHKPSKRDIIPNIETYRKYSPQILVDVDRPNQKCIKGGCGGGAFIPAGTNNIANALNFQFSFGNNMGVSNSTEFKPNQNDFKHLLHKNRLFMMMNNMMDKHIDKNEDRDKEESKDRDSPIPNKKSTSVRPNSPYPYFINNQVKKSKKTNKDDIIDKNEKVKISMNNLIKENQMLKTYVEELKKRIDYLQIEIKSKDLRIKELEKKDYEIKPSYQEYTPIYRSKSPHLAQKSRPSSHSSNKPSTINKYFNIGNTTSRQPTPKNTNNNQATQAKFFSKSNQQQQHHQQQPQQQQKTTIKAIHKRQASPLINSFVIGSPSPSNSAYARHPPINMQFMKFAFQNQNTQSGRKFILEERKSENESFRDDENDQHLSYRINYDEESQSNEMNNEESTIQGHNNSPFSRNLSFSLQSINPDNMTYEQLLQLGERIGFVSKGLTNEQIKKIPKTMHCKKIGIKDEECPICLYEFEDSCKLRILPCSHKYHSKCIKRWLSTEKRCPICKKELLIQQYGMLRKD